MTDLTARSVVTLRPVTKDNLRDVLALEVAESQTRFVAPNTVSIAQAHFFPEKAWFRAIYAEDTPVGFLMLSDEPRKPEYFLWRLMIAAPHQGLGFGKQAIQLLIAHVKTRPQASALFTSYVPGEGSPGAFYHKLGFVDTGEVEDGENVTCLELSYEPGLEPAPALGKPLTHVVLFKLKDNSPENIEKTAVKLRSLAGNVPTLNSIEVGVNIVESARAYDIGIITRFDDIAAMAAYQVHPFHQDVLAYMRTVTETAVAIDYESDRVE
jgi:diamine N-acetyltransferase